MNIKLSKRMKKIADMVTPGRVTADIGCDHGLVSVYLVKNNIAPHVIAMDIGQGPLESARKNILYYSSNDMADEMEEKYERKNERNNESDATDDVSKVTNNTWEISDKIELRISDGFSALKPGETECAVIAGMGGHLIISILEKGLHNSVLKTGYELVLSPQSDIPLVRKYLREHGIKIIDEEMLLEDGKYYNIIKAVVSDGGAETVNQNLHLLVYDSFGYNLIMKKSAVLKEYLQGELKKKENLFCKLSKTQSDSTVERLSTLRNEVDIISKALQMLEDR